MKPSLRKFAACIALALALVSGRGATAASERVALDRVGFAPPAESVSFVCLNDIARRVGAKLTVDELTGVFTAEVEGRRVAATPGIAAVLAGSRLISLPYPVEIRYGLVYLPRRVATEVEGFLKGYSYPEAWPPVKPDTGPVKPPVRPVGPRAVGKVCIDAGHGGKDPGAISRWGLHEKDLVLATAQLLAEELRSRGFEVVMTRDSDTFVELEDRPAVATRKGADLFVAVHANAMPSSATSGIEVFYWHGRWSAASASVRHEGVELADAIRDACVNNGLEVRSVRGADYKVLRYSRVPATLVEIGFLTNRAEEQALRTRSHRQRLAKAIADGIVAFKKGSSR